MRIPLHGRAESSTATASERSERLISSSQQTPKFRMSSIGANVSGMALAIRSADDSETFDLGGASAATIQQTISDAFSEPFTLSKMIRLTFVTGAGKLERQKYDENAARIVMTVLKDYGYQEDRGASAVMECAGTFKSQHDTGKNLKTIVVFPKISISSKDSSSAATNTEQTSNHPDTSKTSSGDAKVDAKISILHASFPTFQKLVEIKCGSWSQKKTCLHHITDLEEQLRSLDTKLINGQALTTTEQELYDSISMDILEEKSKYLKAELAKHVEEGNITLVEKDKLIRQTQDRIDALTQEMESSKGSKKVESLQVQKDKATTRLLTLKQVIPQPPLPLKHAADIERLLKELKPLLKLEAETKGRLLTIKEATTLARKGEIQEEMKKLEEASRGWFEEETDFQIRVEASKKSSLSNIRTAVKNTPSTTNAGRSNAPPVRSLATTTSSKPSTATAWITPSSSTTKTNPSTAASKKSSAATKANTFAAMMADSDSD